MATVLLNSGSDVKRPLPIVDNTGKTIVYSMLRIKLWSPEGRLPDLAAISWLIRNGQDVDLPDSAGLSPLHWAVHLGVPDIVREMMEHNAATNHLDPCGDTPILQAIEKGHLGLVRTLATDRGTLNIASSGQGDRPLHRAVKQKKLSIANVLLSAGADPNMKDASGYTALQYALQNNDED
ncbi:uncharacterized protein A1O9_13108, partial [Exophiala aquamarina CBS 119918]